MSADQASLGVKEDTEAREPMPPVPGHLPKEIKQDGMNLPVDMSSETINQKDVQNDNTFGKGTDCGPEILISHSGDEVKNTVDDENVTHVCSPDVDSKPEDTKTLIKGSDIVHKEDYTESSPSSVDGNSLKRLPEVQGEGTLDDHKRLRSDEPEEGNRETSDTIETVSTGAAISTEPDKQTSTVDITEAENLGNSCSQEEATKTDETEDSLKYM